MLRGANVMEEPFAIDEEPRSLRYNASLPPPVFVVMEQMREHTRKMDELLAAVACGRFHLAHAVREARSGGADAGQAWQAVEMVAADLQDLLSRYRVTAEDPTGEPWASEMQDRYQLIGFTKRDDVETPRVAHTQTPLVRRHNRILAKGEVLVDTPAERPSQQDTRPTDEEESDDGEDDRD
jgi:hypothetical protein